MAEGSQDPGVKLMASQVAEYKKLKNDAEKRSASLKQKLDRVSEKLIVVFIITRKCTLSLHVQ